MSILCYNMLLPCYNIAIILLLASGGVAKKAQHTWVILPVEVSRFVSSLLNGPVFPVFNTRQGIHTCIFFVCTAFTYDYLRTSLSFILGDRRLNSHFTFRTISHKVSQSVTSLLWLLSVES